MQEQQWTRIVEQLAKGSVSSFQSVLNETLDFNDIESIDSLVSAIAHKGGAIQLPPGLRTKLLSVERAPTFEEYLSKWIQERLGYGMNVHTVNILGEYGKPREDLLPELKMAASGFNKKSEKKLGLSMPLVRALFVEDGGYVMKTIRLDELERGTYVDRELCVVTFNHNAERYVSYGFFRGDGSLVAESNQQKYCSRNFVEMFAFGDRSIEELNEARENGWFVEKKFNATHNFSFRQERRNQNALIEVGPYKNVEGMISTSVRVRVRENSHSYECYDYRYIGTQKRGVTGTEFICFASNVQLFVPQPVIQPKT